MDLKNKIVWLLPIAFIVAGRIVYADTGGLSLDLSTVTQLAVKRNLSIKESLIDIETAKHTLQEAAGSKRGSITAEATYTRLDEALQIVSPPVTIPAGVPVLGGHTIDIQPTQAAPQDLIHLKLKGLYPVYTSGLLEYANQQAAFGVQANQALGQDIVCAVILQADTTYLGALLAGEVVAVQKQALESYNRHLDDTRKAYKAGVVAEYDVIRAETAVKDQEKQVTEAENRFELALAALRTALLLDDDIPLSLSGSLKDLIESRQIVEAQRSAIAGNQFLKALDYKAQSQIAAEKREIAAGRPQVALINQIELLRGNMAQTDPNWYVGVGASMDLFDGGVRKARAAQRASERTKTELAKQDTANQINLAIRSAYLDFDSAKSALVSAYQTETLAKEALRLAEKRFAVGAGTSVEVLDANVSLSKARLGEYQALYQIDHAYLVLHRYLGDIAKVSEEFEK